MKLTEQTFKPITILHLSDIQYGRHHVDKPGYRKPIYPDADYSPQLEKMKTDLDILKQKEVRPNFFVVTGDIAEWGLRAEYEQASKFLTGLADWLGIGRRHVVMVPGNHDINRKLCQSARLVAEAEDTPFKPPYYPKFRFYEEFFNGFYESADFHGNIQPYRFSEADLFVNFCFPEQGIVFAGLNSCIDESELAPHYGNITAEQLQKAAASLNAIDPQRKMLRVAVMHHNFVCSSKNDTENLVDADELKPILIREGFSMVLHGHQHVPRQEISGKGDHVIHVLATGSAGLDGEVIPEVSRRCQIIDIRENRVRIFRRCFDNTIMAWKPDLAPDQTALHDSFSLPSKTAEITATPVPQADAPLNIPKAYKTWISDHCRDMALTKLIGTSSVIRASLPEIFSPRYANPPHSDDKQIEREELLMFRDRGEDIENLMVENDCLLIEGQAGSGKTTLIKHFAWMLTQTEVWQGLEGFLPVLIFLKDLARTNLPDGPANAKSAEAILAAYAEHTENGLGPETIRGFLNAGKAVFLLDGLDEISPGLRKRVADSFAAMRRKHSGCRMVLAGRPHGMDETVEKWFGKNRVRVLPLAMDDE